MNISDEQVAVLRMFSSEQLQNRTCNELLNFVVFKGNTYGYNPIEFPGSPYKKVDIGDVASLYVAFGDDSKIKVDSDVYPKDTIKNLVDDVLALSGMVTSTDLTTISERYAQDSTWSIFHLLTLSLRTIGRNAGTSLLGDYDLDKIKAIDFMQRLMPITKDQNAEIRETPAAQIIGDYYHLFTSATLTWLIKSHVQRIRATHNGDLPISYQIIYGFIGQISQKCSSFDGSI